MTPHPTHLQTRQALTRVVELRRLQGMASERALRGLRAHTDGTEALVLALRYGLAGGPALTLDRVGELLGVTRERVRQIEAKAHGKLANPAGRAIEGVRS